MNAPTEFSGVIALVSKVNIHSGEVGQLTSWLTKLMMQASEFPGFLSADIIPPASDEEFTWALVQRFRTTEQIKLWRESKQRIQILAEVTSLFETNNWALSEEEVSEYGFRGNIAAAIVTEIKPEADRAYRLWEGKIQSAQAQSPGYRGAYIQPPLDSNSNEWITLLRFDKPESLDIWFNSPERKKLLPEKEQFVKSTNVQRMISSYPGWFPQNAKTGQPPARWKTMMLVVLCLYPIVILEYRYLLPLLTRLPFLQATFISNVISVSLITWAAMPLAVKLFQPWLGLSGDGSKMAELKGIGIILCMYAMEMALLSIPIK